MFRPLELPRRLFTSSKRIEMGEYLIKQVNAGFHVSHDNTEYSMQAIHQRGLLCRSLYLFLVDNPENQATTLFTHRDRQKYQSGIATPDDFEKWKSEKLNLFLSRMPSSNYIKLLGETCLQFELARTAITNDS